MKAVILAAGEGSRMRPLTYTRPKAMLPVAGRPILEHLLTASIAAGVKEFIFIIGYREEQVRGYFGHGERWGASITYCLQAKQLGTAHALRQIRDQISDSFLLLNGDVIVKAEDIRALAGVSGAMMALSEVADARALGSIEVEAGQVAHIYEKVANPPSQLVNAGLYRLSTDIFAAIDRTPRSSRGEYELPAALQLMLDSGTRIGCHRLSQWLNLSYPWDILAANEVMLADLKPSSGGFVESGVTIKGGVVIGCDTIIRSGSYLEGPLVIGDGCDIGPSCYIRPVTTIGDRCRIGAGVEVKNSVIMAGTKVPHQSYVGDSIIGEGCNLGAGTRLANLRLDAKNVIAGGVDSGRRKLGAVLGDDVETGVNACLNPGTMIGNGARIGPGALVSGNIAPGSHIQ